jgi:uncharacterized protein (DUF58 family)
MKKHWILTLIVLLILVITLAGGFTLLWRFLIFAAVMLLLSYLWSRASIQNVQCKIDDIPSLCKVGDHFPEKTIISNGSRLPTPVIEISEDTSLPGFSNRIGTNLTGRGSYDWEAEVYCRRRGRYGLGTFTIKTSDPLGLFSRIRHTGTRQEFIVYPRTHELPLFELTPQQEYGTGSRRWLYRESSANASRVREYVSGDNLRHIHWLSTAHTGNLMVKEFDPDRSKTGLNDIWLVLDMHRGSQLGELEETTEEYCITIAASLAKKYLDIGKRVGMIASGDKSFLLEPEAGDDHLEYILNSLTLLRATGGVALDNLLSSRLDHFKADSAVIIILPSVSPNIAAPVRTLTDRRVKVIAMLLDAFSFGGMTTSANTPRSLSSAGASVYNVRQGIDIDRALDSRLVITGTKRI